MAGALLVLIEGPVIFLRGRSWPAAPWAGTLVFGMMVSIIGAVMLWAAYSIRGVPSRRVTYGAIVVMSSVVALVLASGGFVIGSILGIIGGSWDIMSR